MVMRRRSGSRHLIDKRYGVGDRALEGIDSGDPLSGVTSDDIQGFGSCQEAGLFSASQCRQTLQGIEVWLEASV